MPADQLEFGDAAVTVSPEPPPRKKPPDWFNLIASDRGMAKGWRWFHVQVKGSGEHSVFLAKGGVDGAVFKSGPRKGKPNPAKRTHVAEIVITCAELDERQGRWEVETGDCHRCGGSGETVARVHRTEGTTYRRCERCKGGGRIGAVVAP